MVVCDGVVVVCVFVSVCVWGGVVYGGVWWWWCVLCVWGCMVVWCGGVYVLWVVVVVVCVFACVCVVYGGGGVCVGVSVV